MNNQSYRQAYLGTRADPISPTLVPPGGYGGSRSTESGWLQSWQLDAIGPSSLPAMAKFDYSPTTSSLPPQDCLYPHQLQYHQQQLAHTQPHPLLQQGPGMPHAPSSNTNTRATDSIQHEGMRVKQVMQSVPDTCSISTAVELHHQSQNHFLGLPVLTSPTAENQFVPHKGTIVSPSIRSNSSALELPILTSPTAENQFVPHEGSSVSSSIRSNSSASSIEVISLSLSFRSSIINCYLIVLIFLVGK